MESQTEIIKRIIKSNEKFIKQCSDKIDKLEALNDPALFDDIKDLYEEIRTYEEWDSAYRYMAKELGLL